MNKEILAIIPARGGSKGIPRKNIRLLAGKPLLAYTAEAALGSQLISRIVLSTEDEEISELGRFMGLETPFVRPIKLAQDDTPGLLVVQHAVRALEEQQSYYPNIVIVLQPTSPLRISQHIDEALKIFLESDADSLVSVIEVPHIYNPYSVMHYDGKWLSPFLKYNEGENLRQKKPCFYARNGAALYVCTYECLLKKNSLFGNKVLPYFMKKEESIDIDDEVDWKIAEYFIREKGRIRE